MSDVSMPQCHRSGEIECLHSCVQTSDGALALKTGNKKRVAIYCRVSTVLEEQENSYETQQEAYLRLIDSDPNLQLVGIYGDRGKTGTSIKLRPGFQRLIRDCEAGKIDMVMTKSISRFARNLSDCIATIRKLKDLCIPVIFEREGINTMDQLSELNLSILATMAQEEINSISQNLKWSLERRDSSGKPNYRVCYGYRRDEKTCEWLVCEPEARHVRRAFELAAEGWKNRDLLHMLNDMEHRENTGIVWKQPRLHRMLTNICYMGDVLTNKTYVPDYLSHKRMKNRGQRDQYYLEGHHEAIVSRELFREVNDMIRLRMLYSNPRRGSSRELAAMD